MDRYSVIVVGDETSPVRRFDVKKSTLQRITATVAVVLLTFVVMSTDYVRVRRADSELPGLRAEVAEQHAKIAAFDERLGEVKSKLARISEFERKVRIIANLPGAAGTGGEEVSELIDEDWAIDTAVDATPSATGAANDDVDSSGSGSDVLNAVPPQADNRSPGESSAEQTPIRGAQLLGHVAELQHQSLVELASQLLEKRDHLASTPAIWPAKGWMTSRFGSRISPFTNRKQFHAGIDIAGERGTDVVASARGEVVFSGNRGPLGRSVIVDHGHGIRTMYGHSDALHVEKGDRVERGQRIASLGSSGRSTGPHLHYVVELDGKAVNPLDYIFD